jgi:Spy/CpxP family protein refolding chaperone
MNRTLNLLIALAVFAASFGLAAPAAAQQGSDRLMRQFVRPRVLMRHQKELGLTDKQKNAIKEHVKQAQAASVDVQFKLEQEMQKLEELVASDKVKKSAAVAQAKKVLELENEMKTIQLGLMIDIKNELTPEQIEMIKDVRRGERDERRERRQRRRGR